MQRLIEFLLKFRDYLVLVFLTLISNLFILSNQNEQLNFLRATAFGFFAGAEEAFSYFNRYFEALRTADDLRKENMLLSEEVYRLRTYRIENLQLKKEIGLSTETGFRSVPASIIHTSIFGSDNTITITAGSDDGVRVNNLVRNSAGVIGRVVLVDTHYSLVQLMISHQFKMGAKVQRTNTEGLVTWNGLAPTHVNLNNVVQTANVEKGDPVVTSKNSTFAPEGIPVGYVDSVFVDPKQLFKTVRIRTAADFTRINHVYVTIPEKTDSSLIRLEAKRNEEKP